MKTWKSELWTQIIINSLIILWIYVAGSKLMAFGEFKRQMNLQPFGTTLNDLLVYTLPAVELLVAIFLVLRETRKIGLLLSCLLLLAFTTYVSLVLSDYYTRMPCTCGGVLKFLSWKNHLFFNLFFLLLNIIALSINELKKGGQPEIQNTNR